MKTSRIKKRIAAMMMVSVLSLWFALPNVAHAKTVTVEGRSVHTSLLVSSSSATATISYTEGPGQVAVTLSGRACTPLNPLMSVAISEKKNSNPTPGGSSVSISAPSGYIMCFAYSLCEYDVNINGTTYSGKIPEYWTS